MNWLYYLAEANIYLGIFYLAYCLFLKNDTHYQLNRVYLLFSCVVSFILPLLQIGALKPVEYDAAINTASYTTPVQTAPVITSAITAVSATPVKTTPIITPTVERHFTIQNYLWYAYLLGVVVLLLALIVKFYTLFKLIRHEKRIVQNKYTLIYLTGSDTAFSFFNYLFIGTNATGANTIIRHELVHIRQKHSADILFLELLKIINWFNPFIYLLQNSLKTVHEYIADEQTAAYETDALTYSSFLVNNAYGAGGSSITHSFFNYNLLKKRIIMLNQQRSGNLARLKYLLVAPVCAGLLCVSTLTFSKTYRCVDVMPAKNLPKLPNLQPDTLPRNFYMVRFLDSLAVDVKFPAEAIKNKLERRVIATFTVADYKVKNIKIIIRGKGYGIPEEITRALQNRPQPLDILPGKYALPLYFSLGKFPLPHSVEEDDKKNDEFQRKANGFTFLPELVIAHP